MHHNKISLTFIINNEEVPVEANIHEPLKAARNKALEESDNAGEHMNEWAIHNEEGVALDPDSKVEDFGFTDGVRLFLKSTKRHDKTLLIFVINDVDVPVEAKLHEPLKAARNKALEESDNAGEHMNEWEIRNEEGEVLDPDTRVENCGFTDGARLSLRSTKRHDKIALIFIINGVDVPVEANLNELLKVARDKALVESNNTGRPMDEWEVHSDEGQSLDVDKTVGALGLIKGERLFLNLKVGAGGTE